MSREGDTRSCPGKVIDTWIYEVKDVSIEKREHDRENDDEDIVRRERIVNKKVTVEIKMEKVTRTSAEPPHPLERVAIHAHCPELGISIEGTDFVALKAAMWSHLDKHFAIKWERFYLVKIEKASIYGEGMGTGFTFTWDDVYKGTTHNGKVLMRRWGYSGREKIEPWPGTFKDEKGRIIACIEATEANREGLEEFRSRIDTLRDKLAQFLRPENILLTLQHLGNFQLLPQLNPPPEKPNAKKDKGATATKAAEAKPEATT